VFVLKPHALYFCYNIAMRCESYKWWMPGCLALAFFFNQTDRVLFGVAGFSFSMLGVLHLVGAVPMGFALFKTFNGDRLQNG